MRRRIAALDVHKRMLMVIVGDAGALQGELRKVRFLTTPSELERLKQWLLEQGVTEVVMESTAQYWKPIWLALEGHFKLFLAQAWSNRAQNGKKSDFKDAERLLRRFVAGELVLSFVPDAEQREMRSVTRRREQLVSDRKRVQGQVESLLEETRIKLSSFVSDLFGASGVRILAALADGITDPAQLVKLADARLKCTTEQLADALDGSISKAHQKLLKQSLDQLELIDRQLVEVLQMAGELMASHEDALKRLAAIPGIRVISAQHIIAEVGPTASPFDSSAQFSSWIGVAPGRNESAEVNKSSRCPKGNAHLRRVLCQAAQAAVRTKNSFFQTKFNRLVCRLGYPKAIWAIARHLSVVIWKVLHQGESYIEYGAPTNSQAAKRRIQRLQKEFRALGYLVDLTPITTAPEASRA
jgi:transposase